MSRVKSAREGKAGKPAKGAAAKAGRTAAPAKRPTGAGRPGVFVQKPRSDIYVALLSISLGAILVGCLLLALQLNAHEWKLNG